MSSQEAKKTEGYFEEIGTLPDDARLVPLANCIDLVIDHRGKTPKKLGSDWVSEGIKAISAKNVHGGKLSNRDDIRYVTYEIYKKWMKEDVKEGDCLIASEGATLGENLYWDFDFPVVLSQRLFCIRVNNNILYPKYFYAFVTTNYFQNQIHGHSSGTSVFGLRQTELLKMLVPVIPIERQKIIGDCHYNINKKIDLLHRQNKTLESMAETLFRQWFVEGAGDWEEKPLKEVLNISIGRTPPRQEHQWFSYDSADIKWISIKDMGSDGAYIFKTSEYLTSEAVENFNIPVIPENTVVLSFKMTVGRVAITTEKMLSNEAIAHFVFKDDTPFTVEYLYIFLKTYKYEMLGSTSSIVTAINSAMIKDMEIPIPNGDLMRDFGVVVGGYFKKIRFNQGQISTLEKIRDGLLPKLMSGEVRVAPKEKKYG